MILFEIGQDRFDIVASPLYGRADLSLIEVIEQFIEFLPLHDIQRVCTGDEEIFQGTPQVTIGGIFQAIDFDTVREDRFAGNTPQERNGDVDLRDLLANHIAELDRVRRNRCFQSLDR